MGKESEDIRKEGTGLPPVDENEMLIPEFSYRGRRPEWGNVADNQENEEKAEEQSLETEPEPIEEQSEQEPKLPETGRSVRLQRIKRNRLAAMLIAVLAFLILGLVIAAVSGRWEKPEKPDKQGNETESDSGEETFGSYGYYENQMKQYILTKTSEENIIKNNCSGCYGIGNYIIADLNCDGFYPESLVVYWNPEEEKYMFTTYYFSFDGTDSIEELTLQVGSIGIVEGTLSQVIINKRTDNNCKDIIFVGARDNGEKYSIFARYLGGRYDKLGKVSGAPRVRDIILSQGEDGSVCYDRMGVYCLEQPLDERGKVTSFQEWRIDNVSEKLVCQTGFPQLVENDVPQFWVVEGMPVWYLRRPIQVFSMDSEDWETSVLKGEFVQVVGVSYHTDRPLYLVETNQGDRGWILLSNLLDTSKCQVTMQGLPFEEVFSEEKTAYSTESLTELLGVSIDAPGEYRLTEEVKNDSENTFDYWVDLDRDGNWEKLSVNAVFMEDKGRWQINIYLGDECIEVNTAADELVDFRIFVLDLEPEDQYMEFGYFINSGNSYTEMYRYEGGITRKLWLDAAMSIEGTLLLYDETTGEDRWSDGNLDIQFVRGDRMMEYAIAFDAETDKFVQNEIISFQLPVPLEGTVSNQDQTLYENMNHENITGTLHSGESFRMDELYYIPKEAGYIGHFIGEYGELGYSCMMGDSRFADFFGLYEIVGLDYLLDEE